MGALKTAIAGLLMLFVFGGTPADAAMMFGTDENIVKIQDLAAKGPSGERLFLGHKLSRFSIVAPLYMTDDGYVIGIADTNRFLALDAAKIAAFQKTGELPTPLPSYQLSWVDYAFGYMFWLLIPVIAVWMYVDSLRSARKAAKEAAEEAMAQAKNPFAASTAVPATPLPTAAPPDAAPSHDFGQIRPSRTDR